MGDFNMNFIWILLLISCTGSMAVVNKHRIPWLKIRFNNKEPFENFASRYTNILSDRSQLQRPENGDPCDSIIPPRPRWNFGQRISDKRCTEYMSDMMYRNTLKERQEKCLQKHGKKPGQTYIRLLHKHSTKEGEYPHMARRNPESDVTIKQFIQHPYWDPPKHYYDIALVELAKPVTFSKTVQPACLPGSFASKYDAYITGWGVTDETAKKLSPVLQAAEVDIIDSSECNTLLTPFSNRNWWGVMDHQLCAGKLEGGVDTCQGDSGGPLQVKLQETKHEGIMHMVIGVTSFGFKCGLKDKPGIYTRVSSFMDWIESIGYLAFSTNTSHFGRDIQTAHYLRKFKLEIRNIKKPVNIDPCTTFIPVKPRFSINGARISDLKCAEYMVDLVNRETIRDREERCMIKRGQKPSEVPTRVIISKYSTKQGDYPHMAAIGWKIKEMNQWAFLCGGSLISPSFVLTAAHCSKTINRELESPGPDIVRLGTRDIENSKFEIPVDINIKTFITNPYWKSPVKYFDIALVQLVAEVEFSKLIQPACLEGKYFTSRHQVTVSGWGITNEKSSKPSSEVQAGNVDIIESKYCDFLLMVYRDRNWGGLMDNQMCAGNINGGVDTCQGDSGGPLQVKIKDTKYEGSMHMIIGVTSFGHKCGRKDLPGVYTKISPFLDWIESVVWPKL